MRAKTINILKLISDFLSALLNKIRNNRKLSLFVNFILIIGMCLFLGNYLLKEWANIKNYSIHIKILPLFISFILYGVNYFIFILGWHIILKSYGIRSTFFKNAYIYSSSQIAKTLPTPAWFITGRLVMYQKEGASKKIILTSTFLEMILHMVVGLVIYGLSKIIPSNFVTWFYGLSITPLVLLLIFPLALNFSFLDIKGHQFKRVDLLFLILLFMITWIISGPFFHLILTGLNISPQISMISVLQIWIVSSIFAYIGSLTLGGIGILREFSITILLGNIISPPIAVIVAAISRVIMTLGNIIWPSLIIGIIALTKRNSQDEQDPN